MRVIILIIGAMIGVEGIGLLVKPGIYPGMLEFLAKGKLIYGAAVLKIVFGVVFLMLALHCTVPWIIIVFGLLTCLAGVLMFVIKLDKLKACFNWGRRRSQTTFRLLGVIALAIGGIIIYAA